MTSFSELLDGEGVVITVDRWRGGVTQCHFNEIGLMYSTQLSYRDCYYFLQLQILNDKYKYDTSLEELKITHYQ